MSIASLTSILLLVGTVAGCAVEPGDEDLHGDATEEETLLDGPADTLSMGVETIARNASRRFAIPSLAAGRHTIRISGTGDADLYVRVGTQPTTSVFDCRPFLDGSNETCELNLPAAAAVHIMVRGFASTSTFQLELTSASTVSLPPELRGTVIHFLRRHRRPIDGDQDHRLTIAVETPVAIRARLRRLVLTQPSGATVFDSGAGQGFWGDDGGRAADRYFGRDVPAGATGDGTYRLRIELTDGSVHGGPFVVTRAWSTADPRIDSPVNFPFATPQNQIVPMSARPEMRFEDFRSPQFRAGETRTLEVWMTREGAATNEFRQHIPIGSTTFTPAADIARGEHRAIVTFEESRTVGPLVLRRESQTLHRVFSE